MSYKNEQKRVAQERDELQDIAQDLEDSDLLKEVLAHEEDLKDSECDAFKNMQMFVDRPHNPITLSEKQREWLVNVYIRVMWKSGDDTGAPLTHEQRMEFRKLPKAAWELNKPLKPPGRK